jgi:sialate O-acetylesterase
MRSRRPVSVALCLLLAAAARGEVRLNPLFSDHVVLQRDVPVPVWGTAEPGEEVTVTFGRQVKRAKAGPDGRWTVRLDRMPASAEPRVLGAGGAQAADVLVGEVWLCSGQSNMQWPLHQTSNATAAIAAAADDGLRLFYVPRVASDTPVDAVAAAWDTAAPGSASNFSAVAWYFGRDLRRELKVPVGLIQSAWGGTPAEAWTPRPVLETHPALKGILDTHAKACADYTPAKAKEQFGKSLAKWSNDVAAAKAAGREPPGRPRLQENPATSSKRPACLYNGLIHPLVPCALRGVIWYQGESNNGRAEEYETLLPAMIDSWRRDFALPRLPFLQVQITPHQGMSPAIREAQLRIARKHPDTYLAVTADVGEEKDIHPKDKEPVGGRLARIALARVYGRRVAYAGPAFAGMEVDGARAVLRFDHADGGLVVRGGAPAHFTIAAAGSSNFVPARARIEGARIVVEGDGIEAPGAVRYAWTNWFVGNLFNGEGLPASPFRTDEPR